MVVGNPCQFQINFLAIFYLSLIYYKSFDLAILKFMIERGLVYADRSLEARFFGGSYKYFGLGTYVTYRRFIQLMSNYFRGKPKDNQKENPQSHWINL